MKYYLFTILFAYFCSLEAQKPILINDECSYFQIKDKIQPISFIVMDTQLKQKKPIFLWCQGSLPYPIYVKSPNGLWLIGGGISNFDYHKIKEKYHLVIVSMPETPVIAEENQVNDSYWYIGDSKDKKTTSLAFQKANYLENYSYRAIKVLKFLQKQKWVDQNKLIVAGHSQGSKVATKIASHYKKVSHLGLFSANPFGRIDQNIREIRKDAEMKFITWEKANEEMELQYEMYRDSFNEEKIKENPNLLSWKSFSEPLIDDWLNFKKPIYLAYGTADITSDLCDLVPLYFIQNESKHLTYKRYLNWEHNFFEVDENREPNHQKGHWKEVMSNFLNWTLK